LACSATQKPIEEVARFLVGTANIDASGAPRCTIIDSGPHAKNSISLSKFPARRLNR
jgi:ATP-dependent Lhr-like helicase